MIHLLTQVLLHNPSIGCTHDSRKQLTSLHIPSLGYRLLPRILAGLKLVKILCVLRSRLVKTLIHKFFSFLQCQHTLAASPSEGSNTPHIKHWCCLYSQFLHRNIFIAYKIERHFNIENSNKKFKPLILSSLRCLKVPQFVHQCIPGYHNRSLHHFLFLHERSAYMGHHN